MSFNVEYFQNRDGTYPVEDFILSQEYKMQAKIFRMIELKQQCSARALFQRT